MPATRDDVRFAELLLAVAPQWPAADFAQRLRERLRERLRLAGGDFVAVREAGSWRPFVGGTQCKRLHDDGRTVSWMVRMPPGSQLPAHRHDDGVEECLVLDGEVIVDDVRYAAGDYVLAPRGSAHYAVRSEAGALIFLRSPSPRAAAPR
jgi:quercetin dioxygenase-like cupin family protein